MKTASKMRYLIAGVIAFFSLFLNIQIPFAMPAAQTDILQNAGVPLLLDENGFTFVMEKNGKSLYYEKSTGNFNIRSQSGNFWSAAPAHDLLENLTNNDRITALSLIKVDYYDNAANESSMFSYTESVEKEQATVTKIEDGFCITYRMGSNKSSFVLPAAISEERMQSLILDKLVDEYKAQRVQIMYQLYSREEASSDEEWEEWKKKYPVLNKINLYVFRGGVEREKEELNQIFRELGYTAEMCAEDNNKSGVQAAKSETPYFVVPLRIQLIDSGFNAEIDMDQVETLGDFYISRITLLPYFSAAPLGAKGSLFYPDGSGALFEFGNSEADSAPTITKPLYGKDLGWQSEKKSIIEQPLRLPVFGIIEKNKATFSIIEQGDTIARLTADVASGTGSPFNRNYASFEVRHSEEFDFEDVGGAGYKYRITDKTMCGGSLKIRYVLLEREQAGLSGFAEACRDYFWQKGSYPSKSADGDIPFYLETDGVYIHEGTWLGFSTSRKAALTTFSQAESMLAAFNDSGIPNISLIYKGWANKGLGNTAFSSIKVESMLGGKSGLKKLIEFTKNNGIGFFPDIELSFVSKTTLFGAFSKNKHSIKRLDKKTGGFQKNNLSDGFASEGSFLYAVSSDIAYKFAKKIQPSLKKLGMDSVSAQSIGDYLNTNFSSSRYVARNESKEYLLKIAAELQNPVGFLTGGGNAYILAGSSDIVSIPTHSSGYDITGYSIPFMAMVLHGYVDYAGTPLNLSGDLETAVLEAALNGCGAYFHLNYGNTADLLKTDFSDLYSTSFDDWKENAVQIYHRLNASLKMVSGVKMLDCFLLDKGVYQVNYANGKSMVVNFNISPYDKNGITVGARDFVLI